MLSANDFMRHIQIKPLSIFEWFFHDAASAKVQAADFWKKAIAFSDEVQQEDIGLCESVQRGVAIGAIYDRGRYSVNGRMRASFSYAACGEFLERV